MFFLIKEEKSCGAIIFNEDSGKRLYLVLQYAKGYWGFAKGHIENSEKELDTVKREVEEETGLKNVQIVSGYREKIFYSFKSKKDLIKKQVVFFLAKSPMDEIKLSFEHKNFEWLSFEKALNKLTFDNTKNLIKKAEKHLN